MNSAESKQVLGRLPESEFFGRQQELDRLCGFAADGAALSNMLVLGPPRAGKTELLRQAFDLLFNQGSQCVPIYFTPGPVNAGVSAFAASYLTNFLTQFIAFRRADPTILRSILGSTNNSLRAVAQMAAAQDYGWVRGVIDAAQDERGSPETSSVLRAALSAPEIASAQSGLSILVMVDDFHRLPAGPDQRAAEKGQEARASEEFSLRLLLGGGADVGHSPDSPQQVSYALCGLRRRLLEMLPPAGEIFERLSVLNVGPLTEAPLEQMVSSLARRLGLQTSDSTTELMIQQVGRDLFYIRSLLRAAATRGISLKSFMEFERLYTEEVVNGRLGHYFDALIRDVASDMRDRRAVLEILAMAFASDSGIPIEIVTDRVTVKSQPVESLLAKLHCAELIEINLGSIRRSDDTVLADYVRSRYRDEVAGWQRPIAGYQLLGEKLKASYRLMMSRYNRAVAEQLIQMLLAFDFQSAPASLFEYSRFEELYAGASRVQARSSLEDERDRIRLPQVVFVTDLGSADKTGLGWRLFGALGFEGGVYSEANEVVWAIALINSRDPLDFDTLQTVDGRLRSAVESWRRKQALPGWPRANEGPEDIGAPRWQPSRIVRWFISKEGFSKGAVEHLPGEPPYTSNYSNLDLIFDYLLKLNQSADYTRSGRDFELIIPIEGEAELIAARTAEQIARAAAFQQESINQIKTALIEACLTAARHGDTAGSKIHLRFSAAADRLVITLSNKGARFEESSYDPGGLAGVGQGRGLQIINALMDDVRLEQTVDGATLTMTKILKSGPEN